MKQAKQYRPDRVVQCVVNTVFLSIKTVKKALLYSLLSQEGVDLDFVFAFPLPLLYRA